MSAISITASAVIASSAAVIFNGTIAAGVTVTQGQALYKTSVNTYALCDNDASAAAAVFAGIALAGGSPGQVIPICQSDPDFTLGGSIGTGIALFTSPTAGGVTLTPGDNTTGSYVSVIGIGKGSNHVNLNTNTVTQGFQAGAAI